MNGPREPLLRRAWRRFNRVLQESLHAETDTDVVRIGLSEAKELTGSVVGWIAVPNQQ